MSLIIKSINIASKVDYYQIKLKPFLILFYKELNFISNTHAVLRMASNQKVFGFVEGDRVIYRPQKDSPDTSVGIINKVITAVPQPRYVIEDEKTRDSI